MVASTTIDHAQNSLGTLQCGIVTKAWKALSFVMHNTGRFHLNALIDRLTPLWTYFLFHLKSIN
uniref:Uncharacterized protein n=1 Tax=Ascaris lumbricoides TaxID=6252 RepID=A0A0M3IMM8_ASCLU